MQGPTRLIILRPDLNVPRPHIPPPRKWHSWIRPGDWLAVLAKPIARFLDKWFRTHYAGCDPCGQRQAAMNRWPAKVIHWFKTLTI
jgi:hypothetical protein